jgi:hypothetical protein
VVFRNERVGAFFYVRPADGETARGVLIENGLQPSAPV